MKQNQITNGYVYANAPRDYATDSNFINGMALSTTVFPSVLETIEAQTQTSAAAVIMLPDKTQIITRFNYTIDGVAYSQPLNVSVIDSEVELFIEDMTNAMLDANADYALPRVLSFPEKCLSVINTAGGEVTVQIDWRVGDVAFVPVSLERTGASPILFV